MIWPWHPVLLLNFRVLGNGILLQCLRQVNWVNHTDLNNFSLDIFVAGKLKQQHFLNPFLKSKFLGVHSIELRYGTLSHENQPAEGVFEAPCIPALPSQPSSQQHRSDGTAVGHRNICMLQLYPSKMPMGFTPWNVLCWSTRKNH